MYTSKINLHLIILQILITVKISTLLLISFQKYFHKTWLDADGARNSQSQLRTFKILTCPIFQESLRLYKKKLDKTIKTIVRNIIGGIQALI